MTALKAVLGGLPLNSAEYKTGESQPFLEAFSAFRHVTRIAIAVAEVAIIKKNGAQVKHGLELVRCLHAKTWEDRPIVLKQIEYIGEKSIKILAENHIPSIPKLLSTSPLRLEELLNRRSPFGSEVLAAANELPKYFLNLEDVKVSPSDGRSPVDIELSIECGILWDNRAAKGSKKKSGAGMTTLLTITSDFIFIDFRRTPTKALMERKSFVIHAQLTKPSQTINVSISSDKIAGITVTESFKPSLPANKYPTLSTRPLTSLEMDLEGLEDVADFWDMKPDDEDDDSNIPIKDLTRPRSPLQSGASTQKNTKPKEKVVQSFLHSADKGQRSRIMNTPMRDIEPRKRSDGKYDCNHTCRDKSACRHMCCRDGLTEPPRKKNDTKPVHLSSSKKADNSSPNLSSTGLERPKTSKRCPALEPLDSLHTGADINRRLQISGGKRLKLAAPKSSSKRKPTPNFDIELATLKCSQSPTSKHMLSDSQSDDDLPNVSELLGQGEHVRSKTNYTNKVDALVRDDDESAICVFSSTIPSIRKRAYDCDDPTTAQPPNGSPPQKRLESGQSIHRPSPRRKSVNEDRHQKRFKASLPLFGSASDILIEKDHKIPAQSTVHRSLFLTESSDVDVGVQSAHSPSRPPLQQHSDDFFFDESYFDILPEPQQALEHSFREHEARISTQNRAAGITHSSEDLQATSKRLQSSRLHSPLGVKVNITNQPFPLHIPFKRTSSPPIECEQTGREMKTGNNAVEADMLVEFESWLESGAVDIVP